MRMRRKGLTENWLTGIRPLAGARALALGLILSLSAALTASCSPRLPPPPSIAHYTCLSLPSTFEQPGAIIRRNQNGEYFLAANLNGHPDMAGAVVVARSVQSAAATQTGSNAATLTLALLESLVPGLTLNVDASMRQQWTGTVAYEELSEHRTYDDPVRRIAAEWRRRAASEAGDEYFLIRDALSASRVTIELSRTEVARLGLESALDQAARARAGIDLDRGATFRLSSRFDVPKFVCVTRERIPAPITAAPLSAASAPAPAARAPEASFAPVLESDLIPRIQLDMRLR
jgi:hypothetical protein